MLMLDHPLNIEPFLLFCYCWKESKRAKLIHRLPTSTIPSLRIFSFCLICITVEKHIECIFWFHEILVANNREFSKSGSYTSIYTVSIEWVGHRLSSGLTVFPSARLIDWVSLLVILYVISYDMLLDSFWNLVA
jgi:hypothetical protein